MTGNKQTVYSRHPHKTNNHLQLIRKHVKSWRIKSQSRKFHTSGLPDFTSNTLIPVSCIQKHHGVIEQHGKRGKGTDDVGHDRPKQDIFACPCSMLLMTLNLPGISGHERAGRHGRLHEQLRPQRHAITPVHAFTEVLRLVASMPDVLSTRMSVILLSRNIFSAS